MLISVRRFQVLGNRPEKKEHRASIPLLPGDLRALYGVATWLGLFRLQQQTRLPARSRGLQNRGYKLDSCEDYQVERYQHECSGFTDEASHQNRW